MFDRDALKIALRADVDIRQFPQQFGQTRARVSEILPIKKRNVTSCSVRRAVFLKWNVSCARVERL